MCVESLRAACTYAAGIVNQFAGLSGLVTMHVGLPSADSFPLSSITASRAHSDQDEELVMIKTHSKVSWPSRGRWVAAWQQQAVGAGSSQYP